MVGAATGKGLAQKDLPVTFWGRGQERVDALKKDGYEAYTLEGMRRIPYRFDVSFFTVPTPTVLGKVDLSDLEETAVELGKRLRESDRYHVVVVKSTVPPGTTENLVIKKIEEYSGKKVGRDFGACMNPEFLREKSAFEDFLNSRLVLIGQYDKKSGDALERIYTHFSFPIKRVTIKEAEMQKYVHNLFNAVKISFFNEMRQACEKIGARADTIFPTVAVSAEGLWNPHYGLKNLGPFSGMCLPKDTQAFLVWAKTNNVPTPILKAAVRANAAWQRGNGIVKAKAHNGERTLGSPAEPEYVV